LFRIPDSDTYLLTASENIVYETVDIKIFCLTVYFSGRYVIFYLLLRLLMFLFSKGEEKRPETATLIEDPSKSRVLYGQLSGGAPRYYGFEVEKGERIVLGLIVPVQAESRLFTPDLILIGPGRYLTKKS